MMIVYFHTTILLEIPWIVVRRMRGRIILSDVETVFFSVERSRELVAIESDCQTIGNFGVEIF
jgi:hypothetical protein